MWIADRLEKLSKIIPELGARKEMRDIFHLEIFLKQHAQ